MLRWVDTCTLNSQYNPRVGDEGLVEPGRHEPVGQVREAAALVLLLEAVDAFLRRRRRVVVVDGLVEADRQPQSDLRRLLPDGTRLGVGGSDVRTYNLSYACIHSRAHTYTCMHADIYVRRLRACNTRSSMPTCVCIST